MGVYLRGEFPVTGFGFSKNVSMPADYFDLRDSPT
jgi:hypothetical protein